MIVATKFKLNFVFVDWNQLLWILNLQLIYMKTFGLLFQPFKHSLDSNDTIILELFYPVDLYQHDAMFCVTISVFWIKYNNAVIFLVAILCIHVMICKMVCKTPVFTVYKVGDNVATLRL